MTVTGEHVTAGHLCTIASELFCLYWISTFVVNVSVWLYVVYFSSYICWYGYFELPFVFKICYQLRQQEFELNRTVRILWQWVNSDGQASTSWRTGIHCLTDRCLLLGGQVSTAWQSVYMIQIPTITELWHAIYFKKFKRFLKEIYQM